MEWEEMKQSTLDSDLQDIKDGLTSTRSCT